MSAARAANLEASSEALTTFMKRVDKVLADLEGSAGDPKRVAAQTIRPTSLNSGSRAFNEAEDLYLEYNRVHEQLTNLSKTLHLQVEAIGIAVKGAHMGFGNLEEEQRRRFADIQIELKWIEDVGGSDQRTRSTETSGSL
ncbi:hypothetical protein [Streptomyces sp. NPDC056296]|uniref:hypothetical protein n=1 Tax=Streptomyces sp. NPDC056296 TaxID=3345775 RepID=UPI0035DC300B